MIVDTSAVVALVQGERPHATLVAAALAGAHSPVMSAPTVAECLIVLTARHGPVARTIFERLRSEIGLSVSSFTAEHAAATQRAFLRYGKGRHRAALNFGDCMTYATAQLGHQPPRGSQLRRLYDVRDRPAGPPTTARLSTSETV